MEWDNRLGNLLGRSLVGATSGINEGLDTLLAQKERRREQELQKQARLEEIQMREQMRQQALIQKEQQKAQQNELFSQLLNRIQSRDIDNDQLMQAANSAGLGQGALSSLFSAAQKKEKNNLAQKKFDFEKERYENEPGRKANEFALKEVNTYFNDLAKKQHALEDQISGYENIIKLAKSEKLNAGPFRRFLHKVGLDEIGDNPETEVAKKFMNSMTLSKTQSMTNLGRATVDAMRRSEEANPNIFQSPRGIEATARIMQLNSLAEKILSDDAAAMRKKYGANLPPDAIEQLNITTIPKIKNIHEKQYKISEAMQYPVDIEDVVKFDIPEEVLMQLPDPRKNKGKDNALFDEDSGYAMWSDGKNWHYLSKVKGKRS